MSNNSGEIEGFGDIRNGARKVLNAAAMTYVVALLTSLWQMFRMILLIFGNRDRS